MPVVETEIKAIEQSSYHPKATLKDKNGDIIPIEDISSLTWSLLRPDGTIVNERDSVAISPPENPITFNLFGNDLSLPAGYSYRRFLLIEGTYDSDAGNDLPIKDTLEFSIEDLVGVT